MKNINIRKLKDANKITRLENIKILDDICDRQRYLKECEVGDIGFEKPEYVYYMPE